MTDQTPDDAVREALVALDREWPTCAKVMADHIAEQTAQLAQCFKIAGADCDGNEDWRIAPRAVRAVADLRRDYDDACDEMNRLGRDAGNAEAALRKELGAWLAANAPGGWIDELRQRATAAETKLTAINGLARIANAAIDQAIKDQP